MKRCLTLLVVLAGAPLVRADAVDKELEVFQGRWSVERLEENGSAESAEELKKLAVSFKGAKMVIVIDGREESMTIKIDPAKSPKTIDLTPNFGDDRNKTTPGIYEIDGLTLRICACPKGDRPKKFASEKGLLLMVLKKQ
jgi:uncharacterized protein (TIGR03067 family)